MTSPSAKIITVALCLAASSGLQAAPVKTITQYGITWTFDKPYPAGQFVTGDWWVVGPVKVVEVSPKAGPADAQAASGEVKSMYGATAMRDDPQMRNGSMIVLETGTKQGYDSRLINYAPELSVKFPLDLPVDRSLISTISNVDLKVTVMHEALMWTTEKQGPLALKSAAVLTCLSAPPPPDAFRPPYVGRDKPIFETKNLHWEKLPSLPVVQPLPSWAQFERYFQRPWLDHQESWLLQDLGPSENQVNYGREFSRLSSIASLMLMLDVPKEQKEKLMIGLVQWGIDVHGLVANGRQWSADGGHWSGRKWPLLFAGLMLDDPRLKTLPPTALFAEDQQTYYGKGAAGQTALYQMVFHTFPHAPYEEKPAQQWDEHDKKSEGYRGVVSGGLPGTALAVLLMKGKAEWNHDAFFDYYDRWMSKDDAYAAHRGANPRPKSEGKSFDPFVDAMWAAYRSKVPAQPGGTKNEKWVWEGTKGSFVANPKPAQ